MDDGTVYTLTYVPLPGWEGGELQLPKQQLVLPLRHMWARIALRMDERKLGFTSPNSFCDMASCPESVTLTFHSMQLTAARKISVVQVCPCCVTRCLSPFKFPRLLRPQSCTV